MKNIHNAIIFSTKEEEALKLALKIKEQVKKKTMSSLKKVSNYSGLMAHVRSIVDGGVVKTKSFYEETDE